MARAKLTDSVSVQEMLFMRGEGLSNIEIAKRLDTSVPTVIRYIGKQGRRMKHKEPAKEAVLASATLAPVVWETENSIRRFSIGWRTYDVDISGQRASFLFLMPGYITAEDVHNMARELACIDEMLQKGAKACKQS